MTFHLWIQYFKTGLSGTASWTVRSNPNLNKQGGTATPESHVQECSSYIHPYSSDPGVHIHLKDFWL